MNARKPHSDMSIEDILESIRDVINTRSKSPPVAECAMEDEFLEEDELHLINVREDVDGEVFISDEELSDILSEESSNRTKAIIEDFVETACSLGHSINDAEPTPTKNKTIESFLLDMLKPQMKEWLDANLPLVVKQVVSEEIKRLVANMNKH